jgi:hypothetical protein
VEFEEAVEVLERCAEDGVWRAANPDLAEAVRQAVRGVRQAQARVGLPSAVIAAMEAMTTLFFAPPALPLTIQTVEELEVELRPRSIDPDSGMQDRRAYP